MIKRSILIKKRGLLVIVLILFLLFVFGCTSPKEEKLNLDAFAQCITDNGFKMYGSMTCSACASTKKFLGSSFQYIDYVECHPRGPNPQTDLCLKMDIFDTPDWTLEEDGEVIKRSSGYLRLKDLAEFTGCSLPTA